MLYVRMFLTMAVSLYTSRVILQVLGIDDFGIYNLIGGVVVLFTFINTAMITATQRFLNFELGSGSIETVARTFSASVTIHVGIALFVLFCAETIGLWFVNTQLNIPIGRETAANYIYQFSIFACCINIIKAPYNAVIIAHEKMTFYAYISIVESILKLGIVYFLLLFQTDKLILYGALTAIVGIIIYLWYWLYCIHKFQEICKYKFIYNKTLYKKLLSFSGWSLFGSCANMGAQQGVSIVLNIFYGVTINAAAGISNQVCSAVYGFVGNFQTAFSPQIVKLYAADAIEEMKLLIFRTSKFSYYLMLLIGVPIIIHCGFILSIWLGNVPEYATIFCQLMFAFFMIDAISAPLWISVQAIGNIRNYQIIMGILIILNLPIAYLLLKLGFAPESAYVIRIIINIATVIFRLAYLKRKIGFPVIEYLRQTIIPCFLVTLLSLPVPLAYSSIATGWLGLIGTVTLSTLCIAISVYALGITKQERNLVKKYLTKNVENNKQH